MASLMKRFFPKIEKKTSSESIFNYLVFGNGYINGSYSDLNLAINGYQNNIVAYRCINLIANQAGLINFKLFSNGKEVSKHPVLNLLRNPYPTLSKNSFIESIIAYNFIYGNTYIWMIDRNKSQEYVEDEPIFLYPLRSDLVCIKDGNNFMPEYYKYQDSLNMYKFNVTMLGKSNIIHIKTFNPTDEYRGLSPLRPASYSIDQYNEAVKWNFGLLKNGARPSGILSVPKDVDISDGDFSRLKDEINDLFSGGNNTGKPIALKGGMTFTPWSISPVEMDFQATEKNTAAKIALAFGVPLELLNTEISKYDNLNAAWTQLWESAVFPIVNDMIDSFNSYLLPRYGDGLELQADFKNVTALIEKNAQRMRTLERITFLKINEKRALVGYDGIPEGDVLPQKTSRINDNLDDLNDEKSRLLDLVYGD